MDKKNTTNNKSLKRPGQEQLVKQNTKETVTLHNGKKSIKDETVLERGRGGGSREFGLEFRRERGEVGFDKG